MIIPGPLEMKNSTQNTPPWQFSELYHLCNNNLKNDLFASPLFVTTSPSATIFVTPWRMILPK